MRITIFGLLLAGAFAIGYCSNAPPARCGWFTWCSPVACYNSQACGHDCVCMNPGPRGQCVSFD